MKKAIFLLLIVIFAVMCFGCSKASPEPESYQDNPTKTESFLETKELSQIEQETEEPLIVKTLRNVLILHSGNMEFDVTYFPKGYDGISDAVTCRFFCPQGLDFCKANPEYSSTLCDTLMNLTETITLLLESVEGQIHLNTMIVDQETEIALVTIRDGKVVYTY